MGQQQRDIVHCAFSTDENYAQHCAGAMASVLANSPDLAFHFHLIQDALPLDTLERLRTTIASFTNGTLSVHTLESSTFSHFRVDDHITLAAYYRLFLPVLLGPEVERIIYLDADLVARHSLRPLWECDMAGHPIAAVYDTHGEGSAERLGMPANHPYFNSGVLVIDLAAWRARDVLPKFVAYIEANFGRLRYHDQDVLNAVFINDVHYLDLRWNTQVRTRTSDVAGAVIGTADPFASLADPAIAHFTGNRKPWRFRDHVRFEDEYLRYLARSGFADFRQPDRTKFAFLTRKIRTRFPKSARAYDGIAWRLRRMTR